MQCSSVPSGIKWPPLWRLYYQHQCMDGSSLIGFLYGKVQCKRLFPSNYLHVSLTISEGIARLQLNLSLLALNLEAIMSKKIWTRTPQEYEKWGGNCFYALNFGYWFWSPSVFLCWETVPVEEAAVSPQWHPSWQQSLPGKLFNGLSRLSSDYFFLRNYGRKLNKGSHLHRTRRSSTLPQPSYVIALSLLNPVIQSYQGTSLLPKYSRDVVIMPWALIAKTGIPVSLGVCEVKYIQEHELDRS